VPSRKIFDFSSQVTYTPPVTQKLALDGALVGAIPVTLPHTDDHPMTQVYTGTITSLGWKHDDNTAALRMPGGAHLHINREDFNANFLALGHIDHLPPHQQRVIAEHAVNKDRLVKLSEFVLGDVYKTLAEEEKTDLSEQLELMLKLDGVLNSRIKRFTQVAQASA